MSSLASDETVAVIQNSQLLSSAWDLGRISRNLILGAAADAGLILLTNLGDRIEPALWIESGSYFLSNERQSQELTFVRKASAHAQSCYLNEDGYLLFLDNRGRAYTNLNLDSAEVFDGSLVALRMHSAEVLLWAWAWLNAQIDSPWREILEATSHVQIVNQAQPPEVLVPAPRKFSDSLLEELVSLARSVNSDIISEELEKSTYQSMDLIPGSAWKLREYPRPDGGSTNKLLGSMISAVFVGRGQGTKAKGDLPCTSGKWLLTGRVTNFEDRSDKTVVVSPGSVVTPSLGTASLARITEQEMALANGHYAVVPKTDIDPSALSDFLNSRNAQRQRIQVVNEGVIPRLSKKDLENFEFSESTSVRSKLNRLISGLVIT